MANGTRGDDPITDVLRYEVPVFAPDVDDLIREIDAMTGLDSPVVCAYIRLAHDALSWPDSVETMSEATKADIRRTGIEKVRDALRGERDLLQRQGRYRHR